MEAFGHDGANYRVSGVAVPLVFEEKLRAIASRDAAGEGARVQTASTLRPGTATGDTNDRVFTVAELEAKLRATSQAIVNLQKQIVRGEETYFEETQQAHGSNLFRGFDTYIDSRAPSAGDSSNHSTSAPRRMPGDYRWFSSSCSNISKYIKTTTAGTSSASSSAESNMHMELVYLTAEQIEAHEKAKAKQQEEEDKEQQASAADAAAASRENRSLDEATANDADTSKQQEPPQKVSRLSVSGSTKSGGRTSRKRKSS
ncbi:hypothetical protein ACA910_021968 [Epithemia clementina (nom. ined.)]